MASSLVIKRKSGKRLGLYRAMEHQSIEICQSGKNTQDGISEWRKMFREDPSEFQTRTIVVKKDHSKAGHFGASGATSVALHHAAARRCFAGARRLTIAARSEASHA